MPSEGTDDGDSGEERSYREYRIARDRTGRLNDPDEAGPRDPSQKMREAAGIGTGLEELTETDGVEKSMQEELEGVADDVDFLGLEESEDGERVRLSLTQADIEEAQQSPEDRREALLRGIRAELHALNRQTEFGGSGGGSGAGTGVSKQGESAVELLEHIEDELERQEEEGATGLTEEQAEAVQDALNLYVEAEESNSVNDPLGDIVAWMRDQAGDMEDGEARRGTLATLASIENTEMDQSESLD